MRCIIRAYAAAFFIFTRRGEIQRREWDRILQHEQLRVCGTLESLVKEMATERSVSDETGYKSEQSKGFNTCTRRGFGRRKREGDVPSTSALD